MPLSVDAIKQVMLNLLNNAVDAVSGTGAVFRQTAVINNTFMDIIITDTGAGISSDDMSKIFDPFFTTKPGGSGLGLTVAKRIIEDHGGAINVNSRIHEGAAFILRLPIHRHDADE